MVESTAWSAVDKGYKHIIIEDCVCAASLEAHDDAIQTSLTYITDRCKADEFIAVMPK